MQNFYKKRVIILTLGILLLAAFLRLYHIQHGSPLGDEADYGYRSYGLLDYESSPKHTTPLQWYDPNPLPYWLRLSFHDAPPLFFLVQHISFQIFGENIFALRFPSAVFGIGTVYLIIVLGSILYNKSVGLLAGVLLSIGANSVYISRVGMLDSMLIFFIVLTLIFYKKGIQKSWYFLLMGISLGLGMMTKYTAIIALGIILTHMLFFRRKFFKNSKFWLGVILAVVIFSPVIIYNLYLFRNFGHFDYALMNMFGPIPDVWTFNPGRDIGTVQERTLQVIPNILLNGFWFTTTFCYISLIYLCWMLIKEKQNAFKKHSFLLLNITSIMIFLIILGPAPRFTAMVKPFLMLAFAYVFFEVYKQTGKKYIASILFSIIIIAGVMFDINTFTLPDPVGSKNFTYGAVHSRQQSLGYNELDEYFQNELNDKIPGIIQDTPYNFLDAFTEKAVTHGMSHGYKEQLSVIILDPNLNPQASLFVFGKLHTYHAWPVISIESYMEAHKNNMFPAKAICYFVALDPKAYIRTKLSKPYSNLSDQFQLALKLMKIESNTVYDWGGDPGFHIYKWQDNQFKIEIH